MSLLIDLARHQNDEEYISLKKVAQRLKISFKYLEKIANMLNKSNYLTVLRGKQGGYKLTRPIEEYNIAQILQLTEKSMGQLECILNPNSCQNINMCKKQKIFKGLDDTINEYLSSYTLKDLI